MKHYRMVYMAVTEMSVHVALKGRTALRMNKGTSQDRGSGDNRISSERQQSVKISELRNSYNQINIKFTNQRKIQANTIKQFKSQKE